MNDKKEVTVTCDEASSIKAGSFILSKGFWLASNSGVDLYSGILRNCSSLEILREDPAAKPVSYLFGVLRKEPPRVHLGTVWFKNTDLSANNQNWVIDVLGRKHMSIVRQLAADLSEAFEVNIRCYLSSEERELERRSSFLGFFSDIGI